MPNIFSRETALSASQPQDVSRLKEMDSHELLRKEADKAQVVSFELVKEIGKIFLSIPFDRKPFATNPPVPPHTLTCPQPEQLLKRHQATGSGTFWGKVALGPDRESQFPVTIEPVATPTGIDIKLHIVPIHFGALEVAQHGHHTDSLLTLAAAAAVAPQFLLALEGGIATTMCNTKKEVVSTITPDHGTPLAVTFDAFGQTRTTLSATIAVTKNPDISIKQAAHLHGQEKPSTLHVSKAAAGSKIAAGVPVLSVMRTELPKHALFIQTEFDSQGNQRIVSVDQALRAASTQMFDLPLLATVLGFTARVVGNSQREKTIEKVLSPATADVPLRELVHS